jgi:lipopolysaccharide export LptBFGC system permease protein LptF
MTTLRRYFAGQLVLHIGLVLAGFVLLFAFVDTVSEIRNLGRGGYTLEQAFTVVVFRIPGMAQSGPVLSLRRAPSSPLRELLALVRARCWASRPLLACP